MLYLEKRRKRWLGAVDRRCYKLVFVFGGVKTGCFLLEKSCF